LCGAALQSKTKSGKTVTLPLDTFLHRFVRHVRQPEDRRRDVVTSSLELARIPLAHGRDTFFVVVAIT
jgi:hypothetical protein